MNQDNLKSNIELQKLLTSAHFYRRKGEYEKAQQLVVKALEIESENVEAQELAADIIYVRGDLEKALKYYKAIFQMHPERVSAEEKYAKVYLEISEGNRQKDLLAYYSQHPEMKKNKEYNSGIAAFLSIAPGFGHVYCGEFIKGITIFVIYFFFLLLFYISSPNLAGVPESKKIGLFFQLMSPQTVFFGVFAAITSLYAIMDALVVAGKSRPRK